MARFTRAEVWTDWKGAGGTALGSLPKLRKLSITRALDGSQNQLTASMAARDPNANLPTPGRVLRVVYSDDSFREWRIRQRPKTKNGELTVVASDPLADLYEDLVVVEFASTGIARDGGGAVGLTVTQWVDNYVISPRTAEGITWLQRGTIDPTISFDMTWDDLPSTGVLIDRIVEQARQRGASCEVQLRQNGTSGYYLDILSAIGSSLPTRVLRYGGALRAPLVDTRDRREQATRVIVRGKNNTTIAKARWKITAIDTGTRKVTLADPAGAGGAGPIAFDDQFINWYLYREATGGTFKIQDTFAGTQQAQLELLTTLAVGEIVQLRMTEPETGGVVYRFYQAAGFLGYNTAFGTVMYGNAGPTSLVVSDAFTGSGTDPVTNDGMLVDRHLQVAQAQVVGRGSVSTTGLVGSLGARFVISGGVAGIAPGDWMFIGAANTLPTTPWAGAPFAVVMSVGVTGANEVELVRLDDSSTNGLVFSSSGGFAFTYRPGNPSPFPYWRITGSTASSNTLTVDTSSGGLPVGGLAVRIFNRLGLGKRPLWLAHPTRDQAPALGGMGPKIASLPRELLSGAVNRIPNPFMRTWAIGINPPDGWTKGHTSLVGTKITDPLYTQFGGASWKLTDPALLGTHEVMRTPLAPFTPAYVGQPFSMRIRIMIVPTSARPWAGDEYFKFELRGMKADGSLLDPASVPAYAYTPDSTLATDDTTRIAANQWADLAVNNFDTGPLGAQCVGIVGVLTFVNGSGNYQPPVIVDAAMGDEEAEIPSSFEEFGSACSLHQAGNRVLLLLSDIPIQLEISPEDMNTIDPARASTAVDVGQLVRVIVPDEGLDQTARVQLITEQLLPRTAMRQQVVIATRPPLFTDLVALA